MGIQYTVTQTEKMCMSRNWAQIYRNMSKFVVDVMREAGTNTAESFNCVVSEAAEYICK